MTDLQCVILAGGLGTRVRQLTGDRPKALIPVKGTPFASHQLRWLADQGIKEVVYSIGHRGEAIRDFVGDGANWGLQVTYLDDGPRLLGTAGALRKGLDLDIIHSPFLTLYGDAFLPIAYSPVVRAFEQSGLPALMTVFRNTDAWGPSNVIFADGRVVLYDKRQEAKCDEMHHIDYGLSVVTSGPIDAFVGEHDVADLSDVFHRLSVQGLLAGYETNQRFYEVGSPAGVADLEAHLASVDF